MAAIEAAAPALVEARDIVDAFHTMVRQKKATALDDWIERAAASRLASFARDASAGKAMTLRARLFRIGAAPLATTGGKRHNRAFTSGRIHARLILQLGGWMMGRRLAVGAMAVAITAAVGCQAAERTTGWAGDYTYSYNAGRNAAGTGMIVDYQLKLGPRGCTFTAEGYQTDETIRCTTKAGSTKLDVDFANYGDGKLTDLRGNAVYQPGDVLFSLERDSDQLITHWQAYPLPDEAPKKPSVAFVRSR